jgi:hypothetical protein
MRSFINVIRSNDIVGVISRVAVVAKRNVAKLQKSLRALHLYLRREHASAGYPSFPMFGTMQPARATATPVAAAAASRRGPWGCPTSRPSTRLG